MELEFYDFGNYYGCLTIKDENQKYYASVENWDGHSWVEIPEYLYDALARYHKECTKP